MDAGNRIGGSKTSNPAPSAGSAASGFTPRTDAAFQTTAASPVESAATSSSIICVSIGSSSSVAQ